MKERVERWRALFGDPLRVPSPKRPRVVIVAASLPADMVGGTQVQVEGTARALAERFDVVVLARSLRIPPGSEDRGDYWVLRRSVIPGRGARGLVDVAVCLEQLRRLAPETYLIIGYQTLLGGLTAALGGRIFNVPSLVSIRGEREYCNDIAPILPRLASRVAWSLADRLIVQSALQSAAFVERAARIGVSEASLAERVGVVPNGIELPPPATGNSPEGLIFVGRLQPGKGLEVLLTAIRGLDTASRPRLTVIGDGPLMQRLRRQTSDLQVELMGELPRDQTLGRLARAAVFVLPSRDEGMPNALLEAMAAGLAVIATPVGSIPSLIQNGQNGLLVPVGDSAALGEAIGALVRRPELRAELGARARQTVASLSWETVSRRMAAEIALAASRHIVRRPHRKPRPTKLID